MFHVEQFMFEAGRVVQALTGKDEEKEIHKSLEYGLLSIQAGYAGLRVIPFTVAE
ncbi:MAG: hypothetical protein LBI95_03055 [Holosporales bacterium]|jgi:hypothetical protein|nr:hypothetical protein [Holosporales bacterium]